MWGWRETIFLHFLCFSISKFQQGYRHIAKMEELITEQISWTGPSLFCWTNDDERIKRWIHNQWEQVRENKDTIFSKCNHHFIPCAFLKVFSSITWLNTFLINRENAASTVPNGVSKDETKLLSLLKGLQLCQDAWAPKSPWDNHGAHAALWGRPAGWVPSFFISAY